MKLLWTCMKLECKPLERIIISDSKTSVGTVQHVTLGKRTNRQFKPPMQISCKFEASYQQER
jgi:hypothetical protein